eukprot:symbB.v1.2.011233.t1/scaffold751.1/size165343/4
MARGEPQRCGLLMIKSQAGDEFQCGRLGEKSSSHCGFALFKGSTGPYLRALGPLTTRPGGTGPFSRCSRSSEWHRDKALLISYERRRLKGDRDPALLEWMQGITSTILDSKRIPKSVAVRPTPCRVPPVSLGAGQVAGCQVPHLVATEILGTLTPWRP